MRKIVRIVFSAYAVLALLALATPTFAENHPAGGFSTVVKRIIPSVVRIEVFVKEGGGYDPDVQLQRTPEMWLRKLFPMRGDDQHGVKKLLGAGSGFIVDKEGYIATNYHVVEDADTIEVVLPDETRADAAIVGKSEKTDLVLLKIQTTRGRPLVPATFGTSKNVEVGDWAIVIGNPLSVGISVSVGIISAKNRDILFPGNYPLNYIQTDASVNRGNSGGPLFNASGEVIGVNRAIMTPTGGSIGIGFAIPSDLTTLVLEELRAYGRFRDRWMGVELASSNEGGRSIRPRNGAHITRVDPRSPASEGGLRAGDTIISLDGQPIRTERDLAATIIMKQIGENVRMKIVRETREMNITIRIGERPR